MAEQIKVLTADGVKVLYDLLSLQDYPNNDVLMAVINAIDETKANKEDLAIEIPLDNISITIVDGQCQEVTTNLKFIEGDYYSVIWDNVTYTLIPCVNWEDEYNGIGSMWGNNYSEYPFGFTAGYGNNNFGIYANEDGEHTFSIYHYTKLLPQVNWEETDETSLAYIKNKPNFSTIEFNLLNEYPESTAHRSRWTCPSDTFFNEIETALESGMRVQFNYGVDEIDMELPDGYVFTTGGNAQFEIDSWEKGSYIVIKTLLYSPNNLYSLRIYIQPSYDLFLEYNKLLGNNNVELANHIADTTIHLTDEERTVWNAKMNGDKIFIGTKTEYNTAYVAGKVPVGAIVVLTDID